MATKQQIPKIAAALVEFQENFTKLSTEDGQWLIMNTKDAINLFIEAIANRRKQDLIPKRIQIPAYDFNFKTDAFKVDKRKDAKIRISIICEEFRQLFRGYILNPSPAKQIISMDLDEGMTVSDADLIDSLGKISDDFTLTLYDLYSLLLLQPDSPFGHLLGGEDNVFYIKSAKEQIIPVHVYLRHEGWIIVASDHHAGHRYAHQRIFYHPTDKRKV
ncbi:MAG: hypothetical protein ACM3PZ_01865 [Bacillota bacterium]